MISKWIQYVVIVAVAGIGLYGCASPGGEDKSDADRATAESDTGFSGVRVPLSNPGFESEGNKTSAVPAGWFASQHAGPDSYEFSVDTEVRHSGGQALRIRSIGPEPYGAVFQKIPIEISDKKTVVFSAWLKAERLGREDDKGAGLMLNASGVSSDIRLRMQAGAVSLAYTSMLNNLIHDTQGWKRYTLTLEVPQQTNMLEISVVLYGEGTVWVDDVELTLLP